MRDGCLGGKRGGKHRWKVTEGRFILILCVPFYTHPALRMESGMRRLFEKPYYEEIAVMMGCWAQHGSEMAMHMKHS